MVNVVPTHRANYSTERRVQAVASIRAHPTADLDPDERLELALSMLICDDSGGFTRAQLASARTDRSVVEAAAQLLRKAGI